MTNEERAEQAIFVELMSVELCSEARISEFGQKPRNSLKQGPNGTYKQIYRLRLLVYSLGQR